MFSHIEKGQIWKQNGGKYQVLIDWVSLPPPVGVTSKKQMVRLVGLPNMEEYTVEASWLLKNYKLQVNS